MSSSESTSIRIRRGTLEELNERKKKSETHDELVSRLIEEVEEQDEN